MGNNQNFDVPPHTNRGAQNTDEQGLRSLVDWVQATFKSVNDVREIISNLGLREDDFQELEKGISGWSRSLWNGDIRIYFDGKTQEGCHLIMSGQACRQWEHQSELSWQNLMQNLLSIGASFTRIDGAIDDFGISPKRKRGGASRVPHFTVATLIRKAKQGECSSKFDYGRSIEKIKLCSGEIQGQSITFGSPSSRIHMICYEKTWERISKGYELEEGVEVWNRFEVRFRDQRAQEVAISIAQGKMPFGEFLAGVIKNYVVFRDRGEDKNKARWKVSRFWDNWLGKVDKISLAEKAEDKTLVEQFGWMDHQVGLAMARNLVAIGDEKVFLEIAKANIDRMKDKDFLKAVRDREYLKDVIELYRIRQKLNEKEKAVERLGITRKEWFAHTGVDLEELRKEAERDKQARTEYALYLDALLEMENALTDGTVEGHVQNTVAYSIT